MWRQILAFTAGLAPLAIAHPQSPPDASNLQGFSQAAIANIHNETHSWVDRKEGAGVVTLLARHGKIVDQDAYGVLDASAPTPAALQKDSIFAIMSMTKPVIGVAMMMFYEQGKWTLDDPVAKHIPEFGNLTVNGTAQDTPMTMAMLLSHSAGFPAMLTVDSETLGEIIPPLVKGQLAFQPGTDWRYGPGVEIQGYLVERWAGKDLAEFLQERVFDPLKLVDTGFFVEPAKINRTSRLHVATNGTVTSLPSRIPTAKPKRLSPSGGLFSTAQDYWRFSQMVLNGGQLDGTRILEEESVELMHTNVLDESVKVKFAGSDGEGIGFGLDYAIVLDQIASKNNMPQDSYYWGGAYGTWFWIDPKNDVVFVGMIQNQGAQLSGDSSLRQLTAKAMYAGLEEADNYD